MHHCIYDFGNKFHRVDLQNITPGEVSDVEKKRRVVLKFLFLTVVY